jgi:hypothetical protein
MLIPHILVTVRLLGLITAIIFTGVWVATGTGETAALAALWAWGAYALTTVLTVLDIRRLERKNPCA